MLKFRMRINDFWIWVYSFPTYKPVMFQGFHKTIINCVCSKNVYEFYCDIKSRWPMVLWYQPIIVYNAPLGTNQYYLQKLKGKQEYEFLGNPLSSVTWETTKIECDYLLRCLSISPGLGCTLVFPLISRICTSRGTLKQLSFWVKNHWLRGWDPMPYSG